jgi:hypothetical protein
MERYSVLKERLKEPPIQLYSYRQGEGFQFHEGHTVRKPKNRDFVETMDKKSWHRILIGSTTLQGRDCIKPLIGRRTTR